MTNIYIYSRYRDYQQKKEKKKNMTARNSVIMTATCFKIFVFMMVFCTKSPLVQVKSTAVPLNPHVTSISVFARLAGEKCTFLGSDQSI